MVVRNLNFVRLIVGPAEKTDAIASLREGCKDCVVTLVERNTGSCLTGKLPDRKAESLSKRLEHLIRLAPDQVETITADNGTEFHDYAGVEKRTGVKFCFARPYHSWERGANENLNGLLRQYLPKRKSMKGRG